MAIKKIETTNTERDKLIILGTAESLSRTPWDNDKYDYWACSPVLTFDVAKSHRIDAVFEMHQQSHWKSKEIIELLNTFIKLNTDSIIYMQDENKAIKNSVKYPLEEIQKLVKHDQLGQYFTSTVGFMVALAVSGIKKYKRIELWGCHMQAKEEEYSKQRSGVEAWLNYGLGRGVDYWVTPDAALMKNSYIYGYEQRKDVMIKLLRLQQAVNAGMENYDTLLKKAEAEFHQQKGGQIIMDKLINEFKS